MNAVKSRCKDVKKNINSKSDGNLDPLKQVFAMIQSNKPDEAIKELEQQLNNTSGNNCRIYCQFGVAYIMKNKFKKAEDFLLLAVKEDPKCAESYFNLGLLSQKQGFHEKALSFFKESILINGHDAETYELMGDCCKALNNNKDAKIFYDTSIKINPKSLGVAINLTQLYLNDNQIEKAKEVLKIALVSHPDKKELYFTLGEIHKSQNEFENAIGNFRKVISLDESNSKAYYELGYCCYQINLITQSIPLLAKAYKLDPLFSDSLLYLGKAYEKKKNTDSAISMYQEWISMEEENLLTKNQKVQDEFREKCLLLANYYSDNGDLKQSKVYLKKMNSIKSANSKKNKILANFSSGSHNTSLLIDD